MTIGIDHAVVSVRDRMDEAAEIYRRLGFTLTPRGVHKVGSINHLMVFEHDYFELIGFPPGGEHLRPDLSASPIGLDGLVLQSSNAQATYDDLIARGFTPNPPSVLARPIDVDGIDEARFATVRFPREAIEGGRLYFCAHLTPQFVWRPEWMQHANTATAIARFTIAAPDPARQHARYRAMLGAPLTQLEVLTGADLFARLGDAAPDPCGLDGTPRASFMAAVTIRTADLPACARALDRGGIAHRAIGADIVVAARDAMNCTIVFSA